ncbi:unnamed protein product [Adineta steineri]|uniref:Uncharacterized protein n=1 Tax=Adineta steineri TaxID=433720 RepID=A0A813Z961_9BILA|nr:unnamed protein product [Adineta steineri]
MLSFIRFRCYPIISLPAVRYGSSSKKKILPSTTPALRHNWLDLSSEICPTDTSNLSLTPDTSFNTRLIKYLSDSIKTNLTDNVQQHLLTTFQTWSPREFYDLISIFGSYGLQPVDVLRLLINLPTADKTIVSVNIFKECFENLLQLKLDTSTRSILISNDPNIIQYDLNYLRERIDVLMCYFTKREIYKLVRTHKKIFSENWSDLDYKINYLKIMLFASTRDIVESGALAYPVDHIRQRYLFVYRSGLFKRVRREEQYIIQRDLNINLIDIFHTSVSTFLKRTTNNLLRQDDYQAFIDSLKYETFNNEFDKYLTLSRNRKNWSKAFMAVERNERRHWMSEFDMYNNIKDEEDEDDDDDENSLTVVNEKSLAISNDESKPSLWHPLSDYNPDRHRNRKIRQNIDPNIRL